MAISLRPEDKKLIQKRMKSGSFKSVEEVIHDALASQDSEAEWLIDNKVPINEKIARGLAQLDRGEGVSGDVARARLRRRKADWQAGQKRG
jgi:Arc/MetJ-type ribon-helix-helix transcriptional regulator